MMGVASRRVCPIIPMTVLPHTTQHGTHDCPVNHPGTPQQKRVAIRSPNLPKRDACKGLHVHRPRLSDAGVLHGHSIGLDIPTERITSLSPFTIVRAEGGFSCSNSLARQG